MIKYVTTKQNIEELACLSALLNYVYKHTEIFKNMREVHRGAQGTGQFISHFLSGL